MTHRTEVVHTKGSRCAHLLKPCSKVLTTVRYSTVFTPVRAVAFTHHGVILVYTRYHGTGTAEARASRTRSTVWRGAVDVFTGCMCMTLNT